MTSQLKQVEEMVKPENRVIYKKPEHFLDWSVDIGLLIKSLPKEISEDMKISYIRKTIDNEDQKKGMKICKTANEMLQFMADKHLTDKNLINSVF